jgi:hypothetical protein
MSIHIVDGLFGTRRGRFFSPHSIACNFSRPLFCMSEDLDNSLFLHSASITSGPQCSDFYTSTPICIYVCPAMFEISLGAPAVLSPLKTLISQALHSSFHFHNVKTFSSPTLFLSLHLLTLASFITPFFLGLYVLTTSRRLKVLRLQNEPTPSNPTSIPPSACFCTPIPS